MTHAGRSAARRRVQLREMQLDDMPLAEMGAFVPLLGLFVRGEGRVGGAAVSQRRRPGASVVAVAAGFGSGTGSKGRNLESGSGANETNAKSERREAASQRSELEMRWRFNMTGSRAPVPCEDCKGSGAVECGWCHSTGVLTLGDKLICSVDGSTRCLICDQGQVECRKCRGKGKIAGWLA